MRTGHNLVETDGVETDLGSKHEQGEKLKSKSRFSVAMRLLAWVAMLSTSGLSLTAVPAHAEQIRRVQSANKPKPRVVNELKAGTTDKLTPAQWKAVDAKRAKDIAAKEAKKPDVRTLSLKEMQSAHGSGPYRNAYFAGTLPWHRSLRDVNLCNGNLFKSFTDMQVAPAVGAGLALQRTYNSQDARPGPFGVGWQQCYDLRMEEENPTTNQNNDTLNYADRTDFFGAKHKYHRDCDGLYSPPPYLFDETSSDYQAFLVNGPVVPLDDTQIGMDGTTKHFASVGNNVRACDYIQDRYGNRTNLVYGATAGGASVPNLLSTVTDPSGRQLTFLWNNLGTTAQPVYRIVEVDGPQYSVVYAYNGDANLSSVTLDPGMAPHLNRTTTFGYTSVTGQSGTESGLLSSVSDALGHTLSYQYQIAAVTSSVWVSQITEPVSNQGAAATLTWTIGAFRAGSGVATNSNSNAASPEDLNVVTDGQLRAINSWFRSNGNYQTHYDSANNVLQTYHEIQEPYAQYPANALRTQDVFTYGPHGNMLTHAKTGLPGTETTTYYNGSQYFQKASVTDMNGHTSTFGIGDKTGADPSNANLTPAVGNKGSVLWVQDAGYGVAANPSYQKQFVYAYNNLGQKVQETNLGASGNAGTVTSYSYGDNGDQWGNLTTVVQDPHVTQGDSHLARTTSMTYDVAGHVLSSVDPKSQQSSFSYNVLGQPTSATFPATMNGAVQVTPAETVSYVYGANGRTSSVSDNRGTTSMAYEAGCDRVASVTDPVTGTIGYTYGLRGERLSMSLPGGGTWTYAYTGPQTTNIDSEWYMYPKDDPNSLSAKLLSITDDQGRQVSYGIDSDGRPQTATFNQTFITGANPTAVSYCQTVYYYDGVAAQTYTHGWLSQMTNLLWTQSPMTNQWQSKLLVGNSYNYDTAGQRLSNQISSLDGSGNLTSRTELYSYDEQNRLKTVDYGDGQSQSYGFDAMGNRLSKSDSANGNESYAFNAANMLTSRTVSGTANPYSNDLAGNTLSGGGRINTWDSENRLTQCVNTNGGTTNTSSFVYGADGIRHRSTVNGTTTDFVLDTSMFVREMTGSTVKATYFMGANGPAYHRDDMTSAVRWYLYDGLGSVLGEVDPNGSITATRKYDVYGAVRSSTGTSTSKHKFVGALGHPSEDETGLTYMRARYYDPQLGKFISQDPGRQGSNWFAYCGSNPVNKLDASGREAFDAAFWQQFDALLAEYTQAWTSARGFEAAYADAARIGQEVAKKLESGGYKSAEEADALLTLRDTAFAAAGYNKSLGGLQRLKMFEIKQELFLLILDHAEDAAYDNAFEFAYSLVTRI